MGSKRRRRSVIVWESVRPKKLVAFRILGKRAPVERKAMKRAAPPPAGHVLRPSGLVVPETAGGPVPVSKLQRGIEKAVDELGGTLKALAKLATEGYELRDVELEVSFSADGKFLGAGVGGPTSIKLRLTPTG